MKRKWCAGFMVMVLVLCSCTNEESENELPPAGEAPINNVYSEVFIEKDAYSEIVTLTIDKILFYKYDNNNSGTRHYYIHDINKKSSDKIGKIDNAIMSTNSNAIIDEQVFFNAVIGDWNGETSNSFFSIDMDESICIILKVTAFKILIRLRLK